MYYFQVNNAKPQIKSARARAAEERKTSGKQTNQNVSVQGTEILTPSTSSSTSLTLEIGAANEPSSSTRLPDNKTKDFGQKSTARKLELSKSGQNDDTKNKANKPCARLV